MKSTFNEWMLYLHNTLRKTPGQEPKPSEIGKRSMKQIENEVNHLREIDRAISNQVESLYTTKK